MKSKSLVITVLVSFALAIGLFASPACAAQAGYPKLVGTWKTSGAGIKYDNVLDPQGQPKTNTFSGSVQITTQKDALFAGFTEDGKKITGIVLTDKTIMLHISGGEGDTRVMVFGKVVSNKIIQAAFHSFDEFSQSSEPSQSSGLVLLKKTK